MPIKNNICVFDLETSSANIETAQILQIGAQILEPTNFNVLDEFNALAKYEDWKTVEAGALSVNRLTKDDLDKAPDIKIVWKDFCSFINKYKQGNSDWGLPICVGHNISTFDLPIVNRYAKRFGPYSKKDCRHKLFRPFPVLDTGSLLYGWFSLEKEPEKLNQVAVATHMGISTEELESAHDAISDVRVISKIFVRFMKFQRNIMNVSRDKIKGCFDEG